MLRQAAHIVVRLDLGRDRVVGRLAFDDIRIERALRQEVNPRRFAPLPSSKTRMNSSPIILRFCSGSMMPRSAPRKFSVASAWMKLGFEVAPECVADSLRLALAHHAIIHEDAGEAVTDSTLN